MMFLRMDSWLLNLLSWVEMWVRWVEVRVRWVEGRIRRVNTSSDSRASTYHEDSPVKRQIADNGILSCLRPKIDPLYNREKQRTVGNGIHSGWDPILFQVDRIQAFITISKEKKCDSFQFITRHSRKLLTTTRTPVVLFLFFKASRSVRFPSISLVSPNLFRHASASSLHSGLRTGTLCVATEYMNSSKDVAVSQSASRLKSLWVHVPSSVNTRCNFPFDDHTL